MENRLSDCRIWVLGTELDSSVRERLGDARQLADQLGSKVGVLFCGDSVQPDAAAAAGADRVVVAGGRIGGAASRLATSVALLLPLAPQLVICSADPSGRAWAAGLAMECDWVLRSPVLMCDARKSGLRLTSLSSCGRYSFESRSAANETVVITMKPGVAEPLYRPHRESASFHEIEVHEVAETVHEVRMKPADPETVDIQYAERIVAGGRGLDGPDGFTLLGRFAKQLGASIAASRVAVDLGWIGSERQVGQSGKTVTPELYVACGISGASHHLAGMRGAQHIVAINRDPHAPIFDVAHLALVADLHRVLEEVERMLSDRQPGVTDIDAG